MEIEHLASQLTAPMSKTKRVHIGWQLIELSKLSLELLQADHLDADLVDRLHDAGVTEETLGDIVALAGKGEHHA